MGDLHPSSISTVTIDGSSLTLSKVIAVARYRARVILADGARQKVDKCRAIIKFLVDHRVKVYGLTTGFGSRRDVFIEPDEVALLQKNLIQSHACGVGDPLSEDIVRAAILLRANTLARGNSGIRSSVLEKLLHLLNRDIFPLIPAKGSVGASGDLAPLSYLVLVLIGDEAGQIFMRHKDSRPSLDLRKGMPYEANPEREHFRALTPELISEVGLEPITLTAKEGVALNNGTQIMTAIGVLTAYDMQILLLNAEITAAASMDAQTAVDRALDERLHASRAHQGQIQSAANLRRLLANSELVAFPLHRASLAESLRQVQLCIHALELTSELTAARNTLARAEGMLDELLHNPRKMLQISATQGRFDRLSLAQSRILELLEMIRSACPSHPTASAEAMDAWSKAIVALGRAVPTMPRVQDNYSMRCASQVLGAARHALHHALEVLQVEINASTDNPLIFLPEVVSEFDGPLDQLPGLLTEAMCMDAVVSGGNFHGEPIGMVMDYLKIAIAEIGSISERRTAQLVDGNHNMGLPPLLIENAGINNGLMIPQYTAAALVSENKVLAHPATVDSIPTCENTEDHVSMGTIAARQAREILHNVEVVVAIEALTAFQGLFFRKGLVPGDGVQAFINCLTSHGLTFLTADRILYPDIEKLTGLIRQETLVEWVQQSLQHTLEP